MSHLNRSNSPSPVDINDDASINFRRSTDHVSFAPSADATLNEAADNVTLSPKTIREEKLLAISYLFQLCYRTVIPNRPPSVASSTNLLPQGLSSFNPRPIGKFLLFYPSPQSTQDYACSGREIARSINNFIGQWRTQPR